MKRPREESGDRPDVSVILPVRNEGPHIASVLDALRSQDLDGLEIEILVVDGESSDDTVERAQAAANEDARVRVLNNPRRLSSAARALGAEAATGRYVVYVDGHCNIPSRTLLKDMVALFERTGADCLSRPQPLVAARPNAIARAVSAARTSWFGHSVHSTIYDDSEREVSPVSAGAMYRAEVFEKVGTFDPAFDACEDVEFNYRVEAAGLACWTSPSLSIEYEPRRSLGALFKQMHRYGLGRARLHRKHPRAFSRETLIPAAFVLGLPLAAISPWLPSPWHFVLGGPYALYVLLLLVASVTTAVSKGVSLLPLLPFVFIAIHVGMGTGYLAGWVRPFRAPPAPAPSEGA